MAGNEDNDSGNGLAVPSGNVKITNRLVTSVFIGIGLLATHWEKLKLKEAACLLSSGKGSQSCL